MTRQELNRDIKRLVVRYKNNHVVTNTVLNLRNNKDVRWQEQGKKAEEEFEEIKKEFIRLYDADPRAENITQVSLRAMIYLNLRIRAIPFHHFYSSIKL